MDNDGDRMGVYTPLAASNPFTREAFSFPVEGAVVVDGNSDLRPHDQLQFLKTGWSMCRIVPHPQSSCPKAPEVC